jgi:DNA-directed RNA polymerase subunit RPC12/RpoP
MGQGFSYKCNKCDYTLEFMQGIGYLYPMEANNMLIEIQQGKFGKRFMEAANNATAPSVEFSRELYRCENCGELRPDLKIDLLDGDKVILSKRHICGKCHGKLNIVKSLRGLKCPKCRSKLVTGNMILWD